MGRPNDPDGAPARRVAVGLAVALAALFCAGPAQAADYRLTQMIVIPGVPLGAYDASFVDPNTQMY